MINTSKLDKIKNCDTRMNLIDAVRGVSIINMVIFHFMYDYMEVFGKHPGWYGIKVIHYWQQYICISFIMISGFVWSIGKNKNLKRGLLLNILGILISIITYIILPSEQIWFGILSFIGTSVLLMFPVSVIFDRISPSILLLLDLVLFYITRFIDSGYINLFKKILLPEGLYRSDFFAPLGFPSPLFYSSDYFPILPWFFIFAFGHNLHRLLNKNMECDNSMIKKILRWRVPVLSYIGRKSLLIYILHQPVCFIIAFLLSAFPLLAN